MQVIAVVAARAVAAGEVSAFGPGADVVFMQKVARVSFLAETLQPVFADQVICAVGDRVFVRAVGS